MIKRSGYIVKFYNGPKLVAFNTRHFASVEFSRQAIKKRQDELMVRDGVKPSAVQYLNDKKIMVVK